MAESSKDEESAEYLIRAIRRICPDTQVWQGDADAEGADQIGKKINLLYDDILKRAEEGGRAQEEGKPLPDFRHLVIVIRHYEDLMNQLTEEQNVKLGGILSAVTAAYHIHFVFLNLAEQMDSFYNSELWKLPEENGIWLGDPKKVSDIFNCRPEEYDGEVCILCRNGSGTAFMIPERRG